jgi:hypothetical protein
MATNVLDLGPVIDELEADLGVTDDTVAAALSIDRRTVERWHANRAVPQGKTRERLRELLALRDYLLKMTGSGDAAREWLSASSPYLGMLTPLEALKAGRLDRVRADLDGLAGGIYD